LPSRVATAAAAALLGLTAPARAGAPFTTDDASIPDPGQSELNLSLQYSNRAGETSGALPGVELNYSALPDVQLHVLASVAFDRAAGGGTEFGYGDTEFGVKYRFVKGDDDGWLPSLAAYPLLVAPTGDEQRGLGTGRLHLFLPIWYQKDFEPWTLFGGGGYWINPGPDNRDYYFIGQGVLRQVTERLALGVELFHASGSTRDRPATTGFNLGGSFDFAANQALLLSLGRGLQNAERTNRFTTYIAYHLTF
jgi:outer membrane putative beta-barrel porin/alpha-amylase